MLLSALGILAILSGSPAKAGVQYASQTKWNQMIPLERQMLKAGCTKTHSDIQATCVETSCVKKAKDITGKLICAKQACARIKETKDITCVQWKNSGTKKLRGKK